MRGCSTPGKQKLATSRIVVDSTPHDMPHLGNLLPLFDEQWARPSQQKTRVGVYRLTRPTVVTVVVRTVARTAVARDP
jgi:hypothetical protein